MGFHFLSSLMSSSSPRRKPVLAAVAAGEAEIVPSDSSLSLSGSSSGSGGSFRSSSEVTRSNSSLRSERCCSRKTTSSSSVPGSAGAAHHNNNKRKSKSNRSSDSERRKNKRNMKTAKAFIDLWNHTKGEEEEEHHDVLPSLQAKKDEFVALWVCDQKQRILLEDGYSFNAIQFVEAILALRQSFPDLQLNYESIETKNGNQVFIDGVKCSGTHTGSPYSITSPAAAGAIPSTGGRCMNDEERFCFKMDRHGKIKSCRVIALGCNTGFIGFYEQTQHHFTSL